MAQPMTLAPSVIQEKFTRLADFLEKASRLARELGQMKPPLAKPMAIPKNQAWFWTKEWQAMEKEADEDIAAGRVSGPFHTIDDIIASLER